jgi:hypothetical protein
VTGLAGLKLAKYNETVPLMNSMERRAPTRRTVVSAPRDRATCKTGGSP